MSIPEGCYELEGVLYAPFETKNLKDLFRYLDEKRTLKRNKSHRESTTSELNLIDTANLFYPQISLVAITLC